MFNNTFFFSKKKKKYLELAKNTHLVAANAIAVLGALDVLSKLVVVPQELEDAIEEAVVLAVSVCKAAVHHDRLHC